VRVWGTMGAYSMTLNGHTDYVNSVAFSSDGFRIVSGSCDQSVCVWDASTGGLLMTLNDHTDYVQSVAFSSDGTRIVSGSDDKSVCVWDASTGALLMMLNGHTDHVNSVAFSRDDTRIVSGSDDKSVRVWDASMSTLLSCSQDGSAFKVFDVPTPVWNYTVHGQHWVSSPEYWIIWLPYRKRLAQWVPPSASDVIYPHARLVISRETSATIDFTHSKMGPNWAMCYSSSPLL